MSTDRAPRPYPAAALLRGAAVAVGALGLAATVALNVAQTTWVTPTFHADPADSFVHGGLGNELAPLVVFEALPDLFPDEFRPVEAYLKRTTGKTGPAGDWVEQYGFLRKSQSDRHPADDGLPVGFVTTRYRPVSGAPSPVPFVGLTCATCHSAAFEVEAGKPGRVVYGVGNANLSLLAFSEAFRGMIVKKTSAVPGRPPEYALTAAEVERVHKAHGRELTAAEKVMTRLWLAVARGEGEEYQRVIDDPLAPDQLFDPLFLRSGPLRTQPFRTLVRVYLDRAGTADTEARGDHGFSKIPVVFHQAEDLHGKWSQFDGSSGESVSRSTLASSTTGSSVHSLARPEMAHNVRQAAEYTLRLAPPTWHEVLGPAAPLDRALADRGKEVYRRRHGSTPSCLDCHGEPDGKGWKWNKDDAAHNRFGTVIPLDVIGTDPERVRFRHKDRLPAAVHHAFNGGYPKKHPLATFGPDDIRATDGYYAGPIGGAFLRAPYLHNASVLTLAELVNLKERRARFYRGRNMYDTADVGLRSPPAPPAGTAPHDARYYFLFDTTVPGNSNTGHDYPWPYKAAGWNEADLKALVEYLKTL